MKSLKLLFSAVLVLVLTACSNNSPADLQNIKVPDVVTYQNTIREIMVNNCVRCHGTVPTNGSPMSLTTYANVKDAVLNRGTIDRMNRNPGDGLLMPQGGPKLPQALIDAVVKWQAQGFQE